MILSRYFAAFINCQNKLSYQNKQPANVTKNIAFTCPATVQRFEFDVFSNSLVDCFSVHSLNIKGSGLKGRPDEKWVQEFWVYYKGDDYSYFNFHILAHCATKYQFTSLATGKWPTFRTAHAPTPLRYITSSILEVHFKYAWGILQAYYT